MDRHLQIVANGFRWAGYALGLPSLFACLCLTGLWIDLTLVTPDKPPESSNPAINIQKDGVVGIIVVGGGIIGKIFEFIGKASSWVLGVLDIAALGLTLIGVMLFFTGRGLHGHAVWARIVGMLAAFGFLAVSILVLASVRRGPNLVALIPISASIYTLWVLLRRFSSYSAIRPARHQHRV